MTTNRFEIIRYAARTVASLREWDDVGFEIPEGARDDDTVAYVVGRCVDGPSKGRRAYQGVLLSAEMMRDASIDKERYVVEKAIEAWERLPA